MRHQTLALRTKLVIGLSFALTGPGAAADSGVKFDREADFSRYETYDWIEQKKRPEGSPLAVGGAIDTKIRNAIDRHLTARGFRPAIDQEPDFLISFDGAMEQVTAIEANRRQIAAGISWVVEGDINTYRTGTLIIAVSDAGTGRSVWSAWTRSKIKDPQNPDKQIDRAVKRLLNRFPPPDR